MAVTCHNGDTRTQPTLYMSGQCCDLWKKDKHECGWSRHVSAITCHIGRQRCIRGKNQTNKHDLAFVMPHHDIARLFVSNCVYVRAKEWKTRVCPDNNVFICTGDVACASPIRYKRDIFTDTGKKAARVRVRHGIRTTFVLFWEKKAGSWSVSANDTSWKHTCA